MRQKIYSVHAYRWGDRECHSYIVGIYRKKNKALKVAEDTTEYRGGKYECEVIEWTPDNDAAKVILPLPKIPTIRVKKRGGVTQ